MDFNDILFGVKHAWNYIYTVSAAQGLNMSTESFIFFFLIVAGCILLLFCSYSLTLVDALDTLAVIGNYTEFRRVAELVITTMDSERDINVSVFETNIRSKSYVIKVIFLR